MITRLTFVFLTLSLPLLAAGARADADSSAGGWGLDCTSGSVSCDSGRSLSCSATAGSTDNRTECSQQTGSVGYVSCDVYDSQGNLLDSSSDTCP